MAASVICVDPPTEIGHVLVGKSKLGTFLSSEYTETKKSRAALVRLRHYGDGCQCENLVSFVYGSPSGSQRTKGP